MSLLVGEGGKRGREGGREAGGGVKENHTCNCSSEEGGGVQTDVTSSYHLLVITHSTTAHICLWLPLNDIHWL